MGMPVQDVSTRWTAERARGLPEDGKRYEVLDGELFVAPSPTWDHQKKKRLIYQDEGVDEYWIVDAQARLVERWRPGDARPEIINDTLEWQPQVGLDRYRSTCPRCSTR